MKVILVVAPSIPGKLSQGPKLRKKQHTAANEKIHPCLTLLNPANLFVRQSQPLNSNITPLNQQRVILYAYYRIRYYYSE